jgi:ribosomal protein S18 acetylase RimI-like enzyme
MMADFDWPARARVIEGLSSPLAIGLVNVRHGAVGAIARVETAAGNEAGRQELLRWGLGLSRACGAQVAQVWRARGHREGLRDLGLKLARPFWRMDRPHLTSVADLPLADGYRIVSGVSWRLAADAYNRAFAEHWRHSPVDPSCPPLVTRVPELELGAQAPDGSLAALVWCELEHHDVDHRRQPVGLVAVVGTVPEHRHHGLAGALVAEGLRRLGDHGAGSASLYVDALNPTRAYDVYRRLGFHVGFEYEVFEAQW